MGMEWDLGFGNGMGMGFGNGMGFGIGVGLWQMGWDGMGMGWDLTPMGIGILPFPLVWVASIIVYIFLNIIHLDFEKSIGFTNKVLKLVVESYPDLRYFNIYFCYVQWSSG